MKGRKRHKWELLNKQRTVNYDYPYPVTDPPTHGSLFIYVVVLIVVDVLGLVLGCYVTAANVADVKAAPGVLVWVIEMYGRIVKVLADKGYRGNLGALLNQFFAQADRKVEVEISRRPEGTKGFQVEPKRWIVERTWTWLENARILNRDYERLPENHEGMIYVVMIRLMLRKLTKNQRTWKSAVT